MEKKCKYCGVVSSDFPPDKRSKDGLRVICRPCIRAKSRAKYREGIPSLSVPESIQCSKCEEVKKPSEFYTDPRKSTGHQSQCKACQKKYIDAKGAVYYLYRLARERAKKKGVPFTIEEKDVVIPKTCPVLGIPLNKGVKNRTDNSPSIDRLIPERGYVPGNIAVISWRANNLKSDATVEEIGELYKWMKSH